MRIELVTRVPGNGPNLVVFDVAPEDEKDAQLVEQAKWRIFAKVHAVQRDNGLVLVVCEHDSARGRKLIAALGLEVEPRAIDEPAFGVAPAWLVTKVVGTPIPEFPERAFGLLVVSAAPTVYAVTF